MAGQPEVLLMDPYVDYAQRLIPLLAERHGVRTVALYSDREKLRKNLRRAPECRGPHVSASYLVDPDDPRDLDAVVDVLRRRHQVVAVLPVGEPDVLPLSRIADALGIATNDLATMERFRDKAALKDQLRSVPGGPRVNASVLVSSAADVRTAMGEHGLDRVVLKPNAGVSNRDVLYADAATPDSVLAAYFGGRGEDVLLEEYVGGEEFFVNGQVDEAGEVHVFSVSQYVRREINGRAGVSVGDFTVRTDRADFATAADYAREVLRATGVRRVPFHLEAKIDERGACLIEVAARLCGANIVFRDIDAHAGLDVLGIAAHHALSADPYGPYALDWAAYDARVRGLVQGIATSDERVWSLRGRAQVEAMPQFVRWDTRPEFGGHVVPTVDFSSVAWRASVACRDEDDYHRTGDLMRSTIRINDGSRRLGRLRELPAYVPPVANQVYGRVSPGVRLEPVGAPADQPG
ncbi:MAG: ATP-grasp domain-containing protein [Candidatus Nanopelagicales bacterium]